jgi:imidazolonepropionase-like amidohydrolase
MPNRKSPLSCCLCMAMSLVINGGLFGADDKSRLTEGPRSNIPAVWALTGARVVVSADESFDAAAIVIRDGKIEAVGPDAAIPGDARVIDMSGRTIYPGFIDAYSERSLNADGLSTTAGYWNSKVTAQLRVADQITADSSAEDLRRQGIVAQLVAPSDGVIRGESSILSTRDGDANDILVSSGAAQHAELTVPRRRGGTYPSSPMGAVALARQAMYDAQWYHNAWAAFRADPTLPRPERNDALAALQPVVNGLRPLIIETTNEALFLRADRFAAEFGIRLIVRGSGNEYRRIDEIAATGRSVILPLAFPDPPNVGTPQSALDVTLESLMHWDIAPENPARVDAAGIPFAFTTDRLDSTDDFLPSLRKAVERGLAPQSAINALTESPARMLGISDQLGTIAMGRLASLVVTNGDLFDDDTEVVETWVDGVRYEHESSPTRSVEGHFQLKMLAVANHPRQLYLRLTQDGTEVTGQVSRRPIPKVRAQDSKSKRRRKSAKKDREARAKHNEEDTIDLTGLTLSDTTVSGTFDAGDWNIDGVARLTLVFSEIDAAQTDKPIGFGGVVWPGGQYASAIAHFQSDNLDAEAESSDDSDSEDDADAAASFAVNYPLGAFGREAIPLQRQLVAFVHATIWTCGPDGIITDGTLLVGNGRVVDVGNDVEIPTDADVIDVRGMHITPGIIDCHSHMATDGGVNEGTQSVTCEVRIGDFIDADDITIYRQLAGGVTTSNILHGSANPIGGQNQVIKLRWGLSGEQLKFAQAPPGVKFALGENVKQSNWDEPTGRYPQTRMGVDQIFRDSFEAARDYARRMDAWKTSRRGLPPRRDLELDALREIIEQKRWIHCHSYRQDEILALIRLLDEYDITIGTFQHILEGYKVAEAMAAHGAMASAFSDWWAYKLEVYDAIPYAGAIMHQAGIVVSFNSDDSELARHLNQEAAKAVKYGGVPREDTLKFVTLNPAKQLRIDEYVGSLEPGKHADLVVWNGDPLSNFARCEQTWIDGRRYFHRDEDTRLREQATMMRNTLIQKILESEAEMRDAGERDDDPAKLWPRHDEFCHHFHHDDEFE